MAVNFHKKDTLNEMPARYSFKLLFYIKKRAAFAELFITKTMLETRNIDNASMIADDLIELAKGFYQKNIDC